MIKSDMLLKCQKASKAYKNPFHFATGCITGSNLISACSISLSDKNYCQSQICIYTANLGFHRQSIRWALSLSLVKSKKINIWHKKVQPYTFEKIFNVAKLFV